MQHSVTPSVGHEGVHIDELCSDNKCISLKCQNLKSVVIFDASLLRDDRLPPCLLKEHAQSISPYHDEVSFMMYHCQYPVSSDFYRTFHRTQRAIGNVRNISEQVSPSTM